MNNKGGTGKSTIAINLAICYALEGRQVCIVDTDKQATSATWRELRKVNEELVQIPVFLIQTDTIDQDVPQLKFDVVVIDTGGRDMRVSRGAMACSDIVVVPMQPSEPDLWSTEQTFTNLMEARMFNKKLVVLGVLNMVNPVATRSTQNIETLIAELEASYRLRFVSSRLFSRIQYQYSLGMGMGIVEQSADLKAKSEFMDFYEELKHVEASK
jgi:chromosome partitioning protein